LCEHVKNIYITLITRYLLLHYMIKIEVAYLDFASITLLNKSFYHLWLNFNVLCVLLINNFILPVNKILDNTFLKNQFFEPIL
jgi:hypothetical protein